MIVHEERLAFLDTVYVLLISTSFDILFSDVSSENTFVDIGNIQVSYTMLAGGQIFSSSVFFYFLDTVAQGPAASVDAIDEA